jgi:predicted secreted hydrolase
LLQALMRERAFALLSEAWRWLRARTQLEPPQQAVASELQVLLLQVQQQEPLQLGGQVTPGEM